VLKDPKAKSNQSMSEVALEQVRLIAKALVQRLGL